ncbi:alpha-glucosidase [Dolosigranulum pigrum]|uniref:Glucohydrolase n=1 Tax=Dolosigranulum pigrum TaxID=29394 RepID=A0A1S8KRB6_9LACT|nr:alpha-glucosidase [Dolosigranulum pigrum]OOL82045.1 glucohydrolase [Dolosigranulum pigrum]QJS97469.1 alpha-glucosidase [Dolosigranulum pigrum]QTJ35495.1 alpha-glucosidase [Dolosigranulum pigrum]QTJ40661.1 alpha-glucosidase [Dolosigranulum pigrum]QTJ49157.1 alpha-glucosidase [Dolosigranulum pigrum]
MSKQWWKEIVAYQVYPRSFYDSNGDGIGDLPGLIEKLDYLKELGIDLIWVCPIFDSPNDDNGYDIRDYKAILDEFGTMEDCDRLIEEVHKRDMKIIFDLVVNHTSDEHEWFIESRSSKDNPYRDYYIWHEGDEEGNRPNNWESIFSGSVWEYDEQTEEYYMHVFSKKQPDLNWENPAVRQDVYSLINWWLDKGIDGFRVDAISHIKKREGFPDMPNPLNKDVVPSYDGHMNQPGIDKFLTELAAETFNNYDIMTVGEANGVSIKDAEQWVGEESGYFDMIFQFEALGLWGERDGEVFDLRDYKQVLTKWQEGLDGIGWNALYIENHDLIRAVSAMGDDGTLRKTSAKALGMMYFFMQGTPFIYQGQEIGMTNVQFDELTDYDDIQSVNRARQMMEEGTPREEAMNYIYASSRDNVRTPMQWNAQPEAGFTTGTPWLGVNPNYADINVAESLKDPNSIYHFYKEMIALRRDNEALIYGSYELVLPLHKQVYAYKRQGESETYLIVVNVFNDSAEVDLTPFDLKELVLTNYEVPNSLEKDIQLRPYEARLYRLA